MHPSWVQQDNISSQAFTTTSQAFKPSLKDESKLSVYNGEKLTAESSYQHFVQDGKKSAGVLAVTPDECTQNNLTSFEDNDPFDGHSVICFDGKTKGETDKIAKKLKGRALTRGWLYLKED